MTKPQQTYKSPNQDRTAEVVVDSQRTVNVTVISGRNASYQTMELVHDQATSKLKH